MAKLTLTDLANLENESTAVAAINANNALIETAIENTLSRDGTTPNTMSHLLDMNNQPIINLPAPVSSSSPARLQDVTTSTIISSVPPVGTSGAVVGLLNTNNTHSGNLVFSGNNSHSGTETFTNAVPVTVGANSGNNGLIAFKGSTSGTTTLAATAAASGTLTLPAATDTLIGKATTDTLTNKTYDTAGTGNSFKVNGTSLTAVTGTGSAVLATSPTITTPGIVGVTNASSATAGNLGEYLETVVASGSAVSLSTTTAKDIATLVLSAGDWDVYGNISFVGTTSTTLNAIMCSISTTANTVDSTNGRAFLLQGATITNGNTISTLTVNAAVGPLRFNVNTSTTLHLVANSQFGASTLSGYGLIRARRIR